MRCFVLGALSSLREGDSSLLGHLSQSLAEFKALGAHHERKNVATRGAGPEATPGLPVRKHVK